MNKKILIITALLGGMAVALGAFGAHGLKDILGDQIKNWETAVKYQMFHVLAIFIVQNLSIISYKYKNAVGILFLAGILFFSGSLYTISTGLIAAKYIWFVTPFGGLSFIAGWVVLTAGLIRK
ncbi:MAG: DUF423 domain-containing protein [Deltaproteobacteria bacterium]